MASETLNFPPSRVGKGVRGLGIFVAFPHNVKSKLLAGSRRRESRFDGREIG